MAARTESTGASFDGMDTDAAAAWADGYGIVSPDVARYVDVVRAMPDAICLAMRNLAREEGIRLVDADTATLAATLVAGRHAQRVVEVGTGIGYLTLHLARVLDADSVLTSIDTDPTHQGQAHEFLAHDTHASTVELRLGDPSRLLSDVAGPASVDLLVLGDLGHDRLALLDLAMPLLAPGALVLLPFALRGGRVADSMRTWDAASDVEPQRVLNRVVATDPRLTSVMLLPIGDGLLVARRSADR